MNLGTGDETSIGELAETIAELTGFAGRDRVGPVDAERPAAAPARHVTGARSCFGFEAQTPLRDGLARTVDWYRATVLAAAR